MQSIGVSALYRLNSLPPSEVEPTNSLVTDKDTEAQGAQRLLPNPGLVGGRGRVGTGATGLRSGTLDCPLGGTFALSGTFHVLSKEFQAGCSYFWSRLYTFCCPCKS